MYTAAQVASLGASVKHLIMIGDHLQLPPKVETHELRMKHFFDMSLFHRLINNGKRYAKLMCQSRMHPEISKYLRSERYPELKDNEKVVLNLKLPDCVKTPIFWWCHDHEQYNSRHDGYCT